MFQHNHTFVLYDWESKTYKRFSLIHSLIFFLLPWGWVAEAAGQREVNRRASPQQPSTAPPEGSQRGFQARRELTVFSPSSKFWVFPENLQKETSQAKGKTSDFSSLHQGSSSFNHYPKLMTAGEGSSDTLKQRHHYCRGNHELSVQLSLHSDESISFHREK